MLHQDARPGSLYTSQGQRKYITAEERRRFLDAANHCGRLELGTLCLTLAYTGCRISEALDLHAGAIAIDSGFIAIRSLKKRHGAIVIREVPVPPSLLNLLNLLEMAHGISQADPGKRLWTLSRSRAWELVKAVMKEAGIAAGPHATPKGLRHGFGLHAIRSGVPLNLVQRWLGHARLETTAIYLQAMGHEEREIAARMWARDAQPSMGAAVQ